MNYDDSLFRQLQDQQKRLQQAFQPLSVMKEYKNTIAGLSPAMMQLSDQYKNTIAGLSPAMMQLSNQYKNTIAGLSPAIDQLRKHQINVSNTFNTSNLDNFRLQSEFANTFVGSVKFNKIISDFSASLSKIDFSGLDELNLDSVFTENSNSSQQQVGNSDLSSEITITRPKKKLIDMTEEDLKELLKKSLTTAGGFSLTTYIYNLYSDYVSDAVQILFEVMFVLIMTISTGQYNADVKAAIEERIEESMAVTDMRKVITKYVKVNPIDQVGFLRVETYLRHGISKNAPVVSVQKTKMNSVLTILDRKNNWLQVYIDTGDSCGEIGWIQESKVIKFKKID